MQNKYFFISHNLFMIKNFRLKLILSFKSEGEVKVIIPKREKILNGLFSCPINFMSITGFFKIKKILSKQSNNKIIAFTFGHRANIFIGLISRFVNFDFYPNITGQGRFYNENSNFVVKFIYESILKINLKNSKGIFVQNIRDYNFFNRLFPHISIIKLPGSGVPLSDFEFLPSRKYEIRNVLYSSRLIKAKGLPKLITEIKKYNNIHKNKIVLHIFGEYKNNERDKISSKMFANLNKKNKYFKYYGFSNNKQLMLSKCDFIIFPSEYNEGTPRVILECMASGIICISLKRFYIENLIIDNKTGFLVNELKELNSKLDLIMSMSKNELVKIAYNSRKLIETEYDENIVIKKYKEVI
jgi:glycosyltransferase involved in cell wall biosynthesis